MLSYKIQRRNVGSHDLLFVRTIWRWTLCGLWTLARVGVDGVDVQGVLRVFGIGNDVDDFPCPEIVLSGWFVSIEPRLSDA